MLQFFRTIRRRLLDSGSLRKYLVYAVGEILLVVIGILIALQINTLNNDRIDRKKEKETIKAIYNELEANRQYLETLKEVEVRKTASMLKLAGYLGPKPEPIVLDSFYFWFEKMGDVPPFAPKNAILSEVINSDKFQLIQDDSLKNILTDYQAQLHKLEEDYQYRIDYWKMIISPYKMNHLSVYQTIRFYPEFKVLPASKFEWDIKQVMADPLLKIL
ncbi:MAG: hypothetical protein IPJ74_25305 [Saprospiraceae bacterium]|nr:hypothetical protein [Saprospiraceae bacterium]